ncbi:MAG: flagellar hook-associated protein FlgK [Propionivibrio sp.]|jgi:flagellar hook-associated protein 1 FlgK|uniref:flagellar hook-associated protein FlgK n=1 Tax=Propionivibrio sp. TaxID=2212460 RepID=UPI001B42557D|nr:flagellar hook-associated protein FlgK [Propionivibrio sp.]MBP7203643.1 flagellar hook-associated protein FlgK [Propionivibrio sp.]
MAGILSIGVTGMQAAQLGMMTTQHNITNARTAGYNRQQIVQGTNNPMATGSGFVGQGVHVSTIQRMYSSVLNTQVVHSQASVSQLDTYYNEISQIDNLLADTNSGVSSAIQAFFDGIQEVASDPSSIDARQALVSSAESLTARFGSLSKSLDDLSAGVNSQIESTVAEINSYSSQIAELNKRIIVAQSATNQPANDLLDQRDQLVSELNKLIGVRTVEQSDGTYNVTFGNGQPLVVGPLSMELAATPSNADPSRTVVSVVTGNGSATQELSESLITGGALGGLVKFRSEALEPAINKLGLVGATIAQTVNAQHALGQDLLGNTAVNSAPGVFQSKLLVMPDAPTVIPNRKNTGNAEISASFLPVSSNGANFYSNLTASDYRLTYDGTDYKVTRLSDNTSWTSGAMPITLDSEGISIDIGAGGMSTTDSFLIQPTHDVARNLSVNASVANDPRLLAAAAPVATAIGMTNTGTASISAATISVPDSSASYTAPADGSPVTFTYRSATTELDVSGLAGGTIVNVTSGGVTNPYTVGTDTILYSSGMSISFDGITFSMSGTPADADTFVVSANTGGVSDGRNAVLLGKLQTQNTVFGSTTTGKATATFAAAYAQVVSEIGNKTRSVDVNLTAQTSILEQATSARNALSGVNLDEEAANLLSYQQAYQASAKMLQVASELFDTLLSIGA